MTVEQSAVWLVVLLSCVLTASGLADLLNFVAEKPLTAFMDAQVQPPPLTTGFGELVPHENIRLHCVKPAAPYFLEVFVGDVDITQKIDFMQPLTIAIHGWTQNSNLTLVSNLSEAYRQYVNTTNYCVVNWAPYAAFTYEIAARQGVPLVGQHLFGILQLLSVRGYPLDKVSLVGFSMGGQIASLAAKPLSGRVGAIYALDPAGPLFTLPFDVGTTRRLTTTDAKYVQVLYTSRFGIGMGALVGHQNFLPNRGYHPQAPCPLLFMEGTGIPIAEAIRCSHEYALSFFTETVNPANVVYGQKCNNFLGILLCTLLPKDKMGIYAQRIPGDFYI